MMLEIDKAYDEFEEAYINEYPIYDFNKSAYFVKSFEGNYIDRELNIAFKWFRIGRYSKLSELD